MPEQIGTPLMHFPENIRHCMVLMAICCGRGKRSENWRLGSTIPEMDSDIFLEMNSEMISEVTSELISEDNFSDESRDYLWIHRWTHSEMVLPCFHRQSWRLLELQSLEVCLSLRTNLRLLFPILSHPSFPWSPFYGKTSLIPPRTSWKIGGPPAAKTPAVSRTDRKQI